jgi:F-type H+-transporting ATPase subunit b
MQYDALSLLPWLHGTFWVFVAVVIFAVLAGRQIAGAVTGMLDARAKTVSDALAEAAALKAEAETILADAKARQEQATEDAKRILATAHAEASRLAAELAAEAQATAGRRQRLAEERISAAEIAAVKEVRSVAIDIATAATTALLRDTLGAETDVAFIDTAIAGVPTALRA